MVSVIIPNYNHAKFLRQRIDSVLYQSYQDFELIILDDNSTDDSREVIDTYRTCDKISHIIYNEKNSGNTFKQWQKGIAVAKGEYIWVAESDDVAEPDFLQSLLQSLTTESNTVLAFSRTANINEKGDIIGTNLWADEVDSERWKIDYTNEGIDEIRNYLRFRNTIPNASAVLFINKAEVELQILISAGFKYSGDWFFWSLLLKKGNVLYCSKILNYQRYHSQTTRSVKLFKSEHKRFKETVAVIINLNEYINQKISWSDRRYHWIFDQMATRISFKNKSNPRYYLVGGSLSFAKKLFWRNLRYYITAFYKAIRFNVGAIKQKIFTFFRSPVY